MKKLLLLSFLSLFSVAALIAQSAGFNSSYAVFSINSGADAYYCMPSTTSCGSNAALNGANLGTFVTGTNTLVLKGAEHNVYKCGGADITATNLNYRIYLTGSTPGSFTSTSIGFGSGNANGCGGQDQQWKDLTKNVNVLSGLTTSGNYTLEIYSDAPSSLGTQFLSNSSANYKATFTVCNNTGALNGTYTVGAGQCFATLASAITALNAGGVSGPVTFNVLAGHTETAPSGGFSITATGTSTNTITFRKSGSGANPTFTANSTLTAGALNDAIFKIIGGDYITIDGFTMLENTNTTTAAGTNNMTEWGVALLYASTTNGAQNCTIQNCTIDLNRTYQNSFGIYSNSTHTATVATTSATATTTAGGNSGLKIYGNTITDVNNGIVIIGPTAVADANTGIDIGGTSVAQGNTITNFGTTGTFSAYANVSGTVNGILIRNSNGFNVSYNTVTSSVGGVTTATLNGIQVAAASNAPTATFTNTINNNSISLKSGLATGAMTGISYPSGSASATSAVNINNNNFTDWGHTVAASGAIIFITCTSVNLTTAINNNTFTNLSVNTTGSVTFVSNAIAVPATGSMNINGNSIVTGFTKTGAGGTITFFTSNASSVTGSVINMQNNNFSNITATGATGFVGINNTDGGSPTKTITGNTFNNISGGTGTINPMTISFFGATSSVSSNTITNISWGASITALTIGSSSTATTLNVASNIINNISSNSSVTGLTVASPSTITNINNNVINTLSSTATASNVVGITISGSTATNVFKNKIYALTNNAAGSVQVIGINITGGTLANIHNNFISGLSTTASTNVQAQIGINANAGTNANVNFNTVKLNGTGGTGFGATGIQFSSTYTAFNCKNNILNINCTPVGIGMTAAIRRSGVQAGIVAPLNTIFISDNNIYHIPTGQYSFIYAEGTSNTTLGTTYKNCYGLGVTADDATNNIKYETASVFNSSCSKYKSWMGSGHEANCFTEDNLTSVATGTFAPTGVSYAESGASATTTPTITDDYSGTTRLSISDIGALEFAGTATDASGPTITYTALVASSCVSSLSATITDNSGINTTAGTKPRLWFKRSSDATTTIATSNNSSATGWKYVESSNAASPFTFSFDYSLLDAAPVAGTDNIQYFVAAQDNSAANNVSANSATFSGGCPSSVALTGLTVVTAANNYAVQSLPTSVATTASVSTICLSGTTTLSLVPTGGVLGGLTYEWYKTGDATILGTASTYVATLTSTNSYYAKMYCNGVEITANGSPSTTATVTVNNPTPGTAVNATRCGAGTVDLSVTGSNGTVSWYAAASGGTALGTGTTFTTPSITATTSYYVSALSGVSSTTTGRIAATNPGTATNLTAYNMLFTLTKDITLNSVDVFSSTGTAITIQLYDAAGTTSLYSNGSYPTTAAVKTTVPLGTGWAISAGTYRLAVTAMTGNFYRENSGPVYPIALSNSGTINGFASSLTGTNTTTASYYFFYNWNISEGCSTARTAVTATVLTPPAITVGTASQVICSGETSSTVSITSNISDYDTYTWSPSTGVSGSAATGFTFTPGVSTTYTLTASQSTGALCSNSTTTVVTVIPATITASAAVPSLCISGSTTVSIASIPTGAAVQWQVSTDNSTWTDISGAIAVSVSTGTITATTYYRVAINKLSGANCSYSNVVTVAVNSPTVGTANGATRCGTGNIGLNVTGSNGIISWYAAASGGSALATGTTFSPSITATTTYYVEASAPLPANTNITLGAGTSSSSASAASPYYHGYGGQKVQYIILASELTAAGLTAGNLSSVNFEITTLGTTTFNGFAISMGQTNLSAAVANTLIPSLTQVYSNSSQTLTTGVNNYIFSTPFAWDGTSNVVVQVCYSNNNSGGTSSTVKTDVLTTVLSSAIFADSNIASAICSANSTAGLTGTFSSSTSTSRPRMVFNAVTPCTTSRVPITATVTPAPTLTLANVTRCTNDAPTALTVSSSNDPNYTYSWSSGLSATTGASVTTSATTTTTYTVSATDNSGGSNNGCFNTASVTVTVNANPAPFSVTATSTTICDGSVTNLTGPQSAGIATIGTGTLTSGTTSFPNPLSAYYGGVKHQMIYTAAELTAQGIASGSTISSIAFNLSAFSAFACNDFTIRMKNTSSSVLTAFETGTTTVYNVASFTPSATGWVTFTLTTPFVWNGSNIIVETIHNAGNSGNGSGTQTFNSTTTGNTVFYGAKDTVTPAGVSSFDALTSYSSTGASSSRPNIRFGYQFTPPYIWSPSATLYTNAGATTPYTSTGVTSVFAKPSTTTTYTASLTNAAGCTTTSTANITVNPRPTAVTSGGGTVCAGLTRPTVTFTFTGTAPFTFTYNNGTSNTTIDNYPTNVYELTDAPAGTYTVNALQDINCLADNADLIGSVTIVINPLPTANAGTDVTVTCVVNPSTILSATGGISYAWNNGATQDGTVSPTTTTTYTVTVTDNNGCTATDDVVVIADKDTPIANAGIDVTTTCINPTTILSATGGISYAWNNGATQDGTVSPTTTTTYTVTVTSIKGCISTDDVVVTVDQTSPSANAGADATVTCANPSTVLNAIGGVSYVWSTGDFYPSITVSPTVTTTYTVTVTGANGCTATDNVVVTVDQTPPTVNAGIDVTIDCVVPGSTLDATGNAVSYAWNHGAMQNDVVSPTVNTTYSVTATGANGCTAVDEKQVSVDKDVPTANAGADVTVTCTNPSATLTATGGVGYSWLSGEVDATINVSPTVTTTYTVVVIADNGCTATDDVVVTADKTDPSANAGADVTVTCSNPSTVLNATGGVNNAWSTGDFYPSITVNPTVTTTYTVTVTGANGCTSTDAVVVTVDQTPPMVNAGMDVTIDCIVSGSTLDATGNAVSYAWNNGAMQNDVVSPTVNTTYSVTATGVNGCTTVDEKQVSVDKDVPTANAGADVTVTCTNPTATLTATGGVGYSWLNGEVDATINVSPTVTTTYTVVVIADNGCTATDDVVVTADKTSPVVNAGADVTVTCSSPSTTLTAMGGVAYVWNNGATQGGSVAPTTTTTYTVTVTAANGCTSTDALAVVVNKTSPIANAGVDIALTTLNPNGTLMATGGGSYLWNTGETTASISISVTTMTVFTVTVTAANGCTDTDDVTVFYTNSDITPPVFTFVPANVTLNCQSAGSIPGKDVAEMLATAEDDYPGVIVTIVQDSTKGTSRSACNYYNYTFTNTWTATDASGNTATARQVITVRDVTAPTIGAAPANITIHESKGDTIPSPATLTATDFCSTATVTSNDVKANLPKPACFSSLYTITRTWTATDVCGNTSTTAQVITASDEVLLTCPKNPPVLTTTSDGQNNYNCSTLVLASNNFRPTFSDACDLSVLKYTLSGATMGNGTGSISGTALNSGVTTVTYTAQFSNPVSCSFTVTVLDQEKPKVNVTVPTVIVDDCDFSAPLTNAPVPTDNCSAVTTTTSDVMADLSSTCKTKAATLKYTKSLTRKYTVTDASGNSAMATQVFYLRDQLAPTASCNPNVTITIGNTNVTTTASSFNGTSSDNCSGALSYTVCTGASCTNFATSTTFTKAMLGTANTVTRPFTLKVLDACGNASTCSSTVTLKKAGTMGSFNNNTALLNTQSDESAAATTVQTPSETVTAHGEMKCFPNPFSEDLNIQYNLTEDVENVTLKLYDNQGRMVAKMENGQSLAGYYSVRWNLSHLDASMYHVCLELNGKCQQTHRVLMMK